MIVVAGGEVPHRRRELRLPRAAAVIAADGGVDRAIALGLDVELAIGDFDSVTVGGLAAAEGAGARVVRHPSAKDATDLELALDAALALGPETIVVVGSDRGRLDHLLGSVLLLGDERYAGVEIDGYFGDARIHVVRDARTLTGAPGELVSLIALHGPADGVTTEGLAYPLARETLRPGSSRGLSNRFTAPEATVSVARGTIAVIRPGEGAE